MALIELSGVTKTYPGRRGGPPVHAVRDVDLSVEAGEIVGIVGYSGAGKSTLVRLVNALESATAGSISVNGTVITGLSERRLQPVRRTIGMIFQQFNLFHSRTVYGNVAYPLQVAGVPRAEQHERIVQLLTFVGLADKAHAHPEQLSGGQKQRVGIARALATEPKVLLCDEATSALDPETTEDILTLLDQLNRELGLTIVLITHQMEVVRRVCDRVAVMKDGRVVEQGATADVFLHPHHETTRAMLAEGEEAFDASVVPPGARLAKLTFRGAATYEPELSRVARSVGVDYSILSGRISRIRGEPYGQLTVAFTGGDAEAAVARLTDRGVRVEAA